jgi:hypothetical protein
MDELPITAAAAKQFADLAIQAANDSLSQGSPYAAFLNSPSVALTWTSPQLTQVHQTAIDLQQGIAELFARRVAQIKVVEYSYVWNEAVAENAQEALADAQNKLQDFKKQIEQLKKQKEQAEADIKTARGVCEQMGTPISECDLSVPTKQWQTADDKLNKSPTDTMDRTGKNAPKGMIKAASYLEDSFIPSKKKEKDGAGLASQHASDLLKILVTDPIQPAHSPEALSGQVTAMRQHLKQGVKSQEVLAAMAYSASIENGSAKNTIDKLGTAIQAQYELWDTTRIPGPLQDAMQTYVQPYTTNPTDWTAKQWAGNLAVMVGPLLTVDKIMDIVQVGATRALGMGVTESTMAGISNPLYSLGQYFNVYGYIEVAGSAACGSNYDKPVISIASGDCALLKLLYGK